ncbi:MAG: hypothetical protein OXC40_00830, partial [Proteobacteria bacterium]|nr:hypothetical protein [Pseudomonadota bacterium]
MIHFVKHKCLILGVLAFGLSSCALAKKRCDNELTSNLPSKTKYSGYITWRDYSHNVTDFGIAGHHTMTEKCLVLVEKDPSVNSWNQLHLITSFHCIRHLIYDGIRQNRHKLHLMLVMDADAKKPECSKTVAIKFSVSNTLITVPEKGQDHKSRPFSATSPQLTAWHFLLKPLLTPSSSHENYKTLANEVEKTITTHMKNLDLAVADKIIQDHGRDIEKKKERAIKLADICYDDNQESHEPNSRKKFACFLSSDIFIFTLNSNLNDLTSDFHQKKSCLIPHKNLAFDLGLESYQLEDLPKKPKPWIGIHHIFH